jgi:hypothetical protein
LLKKVARSAERLLTSFVQKRCAAGARWLCELLKWTLLGVPLNMRHSLTAWGARRAPRRHCCWPQQPARLLCGFPGCVEAGPGLTRLLAAQIHPHCSAVLVNTRDVKNYPRRVAKPESMRFGPCARRSTVWLARRISHRKCAHIFPARATNILQ